MILLAGFLEVIFKALVLAGFALVAGGVAFGLAVLLPLRARIPASALERSLSLIAAGGAMVLVFALATILIEPWALEDGLGRWHIAEFLGTTFALAALAHAAAGGAVFLLALRGRVRPGSGSTWAVLVTAAILVAATGAPLVHGASRLEGAAALTTFTVLHQVGAGIWVGGLVHLLAQGRLRRDRSSAAPWTAMVARFSRVAISGVVVIAASGGFLAWRYIATPAGLVGTAYGAMVLTKAALMGAALLLGARNFRAARRWRRREEPLRSEETHVRSLVEAEAGTVLVILLAAAALTSQPPAVDVKEKATPREVAEMFTPKRPRLVPPPYREMVVTAAPSLDPYALPGALDRAQSNFNHNVAGLLVLLTAVGALLDHGGKIAAARHWPLAFLALAAFMLVIAEPNGWPFGPEAFFATLLSPSALMHRAATALVVGLALFEWRVRVGGLGATRWRFAFPLLAGAGGALLLTHSHSVLSSKSAYLIEVSHDAIALLAVLVGMTRWLEIRSTDPRERRAYGLIWPTCMALVGLVLVFYRET